MSRRERLVIIFLLACAACGLAVSFYKKAHTTPITVAPSHLAKDLYAVKFDKKLININTADEEKLASLPGIGPVLAKDIITYRQQNGLFGLPDEITKVLGIGKAKYNRIKDLITTE